MEHPFPYPPLSKEALDALARIEGATSLKGIERDFSTVQSEAYRHFGPSLIIALFVVIPVTAAFMALQFAGGFDRRDLWLYAFIPLVTFAVSRGAEYVLRGPRREEDVRRMRDALNVWNVLNRTEKRA